MMEKESREGKDVKWVLIVSLVMFFVLEWWYFLDLPFSYVSFGFWFLIYFINILSVVLTVTLATLNKAGFWETEITYQVTIFFFILSMVLFFVSQFELILRVVY